MTELYLVTERLSSFAAKIDRICSSWFFVRSIMQTNMDGIKATLEWSNNGLTFRGNCHVITQFG